MENKWEITEKMPEEFSSKFPELNPIILQLLYNRGLTDQNKIDEFLLPDYSQDINDPFIFQDMEKAVARIFRAIDQQEKILIYGDYDTDGVTATTVLYNGLRKLGGEDIDYYLPDREKEGYGLNKEAIKSFQQQGVKLIITCDCGVSNREEIALAQELGMEVIVTDHHLEPEQLPENCLIIDPHLSREKYPFKYLAGVGVAFKLIQGLLARADQSIAGREAFEKWLLDLVAIGTIGDMMPILGENRTIVRYGMIVLNKTSNLGLRALVECAKLTWGKITAQDVGYRLSSRLNAAGRMKHANNALELLLSTDEREARRLAKELDQLNRDRQSQIETIIRQLKKKLGQQPKEKVLMIKSKKWPVGILGIIASRLLDYYHRPTLIFTNKKEGWRGSGRAPAFFHLFNSLRAFSKYFIDFGGHAGAAGCTLKSSIDFEKFREEFLQLADEQLDFDQFRGKVKIEAEINFADLNWALQEELEKFEPFGKGNVCPYFLVRDLALKDIKAVGRNGNHHQLIVDDYRKLIFFNSNSRMDQLVIGDQIDAVLELGVNQWNGQQELQMKVIDLKKHVG